MMSCVRRELEGCQEVITVRWVWMNEEEVGWKTKGDLG